MNLFLVKAKYDRTGENGVISEQYLIDTPTWSEAERLAFEHVTQYSTGEVLIVDISRYNVSDIITPDVGDRYYKVKVDLITLDERTGREKKSHNFILVGSDTLDAAKSSVESFMKDSIVDCAISKIEETSIIDIIYG